MSDKELQHHELPNGQLSLLPREEVERLTEQEIQHRQYKQGIYSGIDAKRKVPELYALAVTWIAEGKFSEVEISRRTGFCRNLIRGIKRAQTEDIAQIKKEIRVQALDAAAMTLDAFRERMISLLADPAALAKISPERLSLAYCQLVDKGLLVAGEVTQRFETIAATPSVDEFERQFLALQALPAADVLEVTETDTETEGGEAKGD